jgi:hypothetical protein
MSAHGRRVMKAARRKDMAASITQPSAYVPASRPARGDSAYADLGALLPALGFYERHDKSC